MGPFADLEAAEHGLVGREESEILTQAAVDAMQPRRSIMARRPSVVQFAGLAEAAAVEVDPATAAVDPAAAAVGAAVAPGQLTGGSEAASSRFKVLFSIETYLVLTMSEDWHLLEP